MIEKLLIEFKDNFIPVQITLDTKNLPTVHALDRDGELHENQGETLLEALNKMKDKLIVN